MIQSENAIAHQLLGKPALAKSFRVSVDGSQESLEVLASGPADAVGTYVKHIKPNKTLTVTLTEKGKLPQNYLIEVCYKIQNVTPDGGGISPRRTL